MKKRIVFYLLAGIAYWVLWQSLYLTRVALESSFSGTYMIGEAWRILYLTAINFLFFEFLFNRSDIRNKRWLLLAAKTLLAFLLLTFGFYYWMYWGQQLKISPFPTEKYAVWKMALAFFYSSQLSVIYFGAVNYYFDNLKLRKDKQQLLIEKQQSELNYLKAQTNPHFLFNTLNNIYSLARDKSDLAADSILRLSKILRFMLYETGNPYIPIEQEIKIIEDYLELEKMRYDDNLEVSLEKDIDNPKQAIPPLVLVPLVENAFKHGVSETRTPPFIRMNLFLKDALLKFSIINSVGERKDNAVIKENIGLGNIRKQLELQFQQYELTARQCENEFQVELKINLNSHEQGKNNLHSGGR
jgi:hypothetical protein